ncbi:RHS repeat-associated core domain-containing protein [Mucilaginibacter sabulilitoris]|uniref:RHS repeat-associated core domain-containing protein n=1 Tax=Mucilaginibacter sabulilitoris TaxID=1173583 RepID=A0ABZ0TS76_9SPHI|nr:RHS repeat-associated core domain-containing protein [Mucilaginibacter sabulilitoris]WPU94325.1 RHS repeat-associated core domain-containing protein [Mucilaginibacter sabulilitoris]
MQTEEGRVLNPTTSPNYEYTLTDHLGNNRLAFDQMNGKVGEDDYYPFGLNVHRQVNAGKKCLYNKKELQDELNQYDYGARFYDPVIARWTTVDPLAEKGRRWSPYNYVWDNPMRFIDPDGMEGDDPWYVKVGKAIANFFVGNTGDTYKNVEEYATNKVDYIKNRGQRYGEAVRNGQNPSDVDKEYTYKQTVVGIKLADNAINYIGLNTMAAEGSVAGMLKQSSTDLIRGIDFKSLSKEEIKSIASNSKQIFSHQEKLEEYIANPMKGDNANVLKKAKSDAIREEIYKGRITKLENEIKKFQDNIRKIIEPVTKKP